MELLEAKEVHHRFPDGTTALRGIDFQISAGEFVFIAGPNGSGKSVLMRHFNGLLSPTKGNILFRGKPVKDQLNTVRQRVGLVFQDADKQIVGQTVKEDIAFGPANLGLPYPEIEKRISESADMVGITHLLNHRPHTLSGGEKRRLALAGILSMHPEVIILDEPFAGLDYPGIRSVLREIIRLNKQGCAIILISHDVGKALAHADRLVLLNRGRIEAQGAPETLLDRLEESGIRRPKGSVEDFTWLN